MDQYEKRHEIMLLEEWDKRVNKVNSLETLFTTQELELFAGKANRGSLAGRYIIKKLLFTHLQHAGDYREIEILNDDFGKPILRLSDHLQSCCQSKGIRHVCCSISHSRKRVVGMIIFDKGGKRII
jgi:phosphopantetheinyl transferase (holo-ACP synthase)